MNIFYTNWNPRLCAQEHCDKHCVKMILEYAQILSTAHRSLDGQAQIVISEKGRKSTAWQLDDPILDALMYKATHINHPSTRWACESATNYQWLANLLNQLCLEYTHRYGKIHKTARIGLVDVLMRTAPKALRFCTKPVTPPTLAMPDEYKNGDHEVAYQKYILGEKSHMLHWKNRTPPVWYTMHNNVNELMAS